MGRRERKMKKTGTKRHIWVGRDGPRGGASGMYCVSYSRRGITSHLDWGGERRFHGGVGVCPEDFEDATGIQLRRGEGPVLVKITAHIVKPQKKARAK